MISQTTPAGFKPGEPSEIHRRLRLARSLEHAARLRAEREDVSGLDEVAGSGPRVDRHLDRARSIVRGDAGRDTLPCLDGDGEGRSERRLVPLGHRPQRELVAPVRREAEADEASRVRRHEVDRLGSDELRGDRQVALVLAVGVVDDDDEPPGADVLDRLFDRRERRDRLPRGCMDGHCEIVALSRLTVGRLALRTSRERRLRG